MENRARSDEPEPSGAGGRLSGAPSDYLGMTLRVIELC